MQTDAWLYSGTFQGWQICQPDLDRSCEQLSQLLGFGIFIDFRLFSPMLSIVGIDDLESRMDVDTLEIVERRVVFSYCPGVKCGEKTVYILLDWFQTVWGSSL